MQVGNKKEEAKSMTEEGITGAFIRDLKNSTRTVCFVTGSGEHRIDDSDRSGYSRFKELLGKDNYEAKSINLLQKAEVPGRLHGSGRRRAHRRLPAAGSRCHQEISSKMAAALSSCSIRR